MAKLTNSGVETSLNLPTVAPAFNWNFRRGKHLNPLLTFSRNSAVASHFDELGILKSDTANIPRFNHLLRVSRGLLIEKSVTNLYINSETFTGGARTTVNSNVTTAPDGTLADEMVETTDTGEHFANDRIIAVTVGDSLFYSFYIKQTATTENRRFLLRLATAATVNVYFDFSTKSIVATTTGGDYISSSVVNLDNGWFYIVVRATAASTGNVVARVQFAKSDNTLLYAGDTGESIAIWGGHFSISNGAGNSYIKTAEASVTRALDLLTVSTVNFNFYRQNEFSVYASFYGQSYGTCTIWSIHDGTANERIYLESINGALTLKIVDGGVEQCSLAIGTVVTGTEYRVAATWKLNDIAASINGATVVTDTSATLPTPTQMSVGSNYAGANQMNGEIAVLTGWAKRLTNVELQGLSL